MIIDVLFYFLVAFAIFKGFTKGLVVGVFSFISYFIGLAAALKLSSYVAQRLAGDEPEPSVWMPFLSFFLVFVAVVIIVNIVARIIRSALKATMMGWLDRLGGIFFFVLIYLFIFSIFLFYGTEMNWVGERAREESKVYLYIMPVAPWMMKIAGFVLPVFKDLFENLKSFFENLATHKQAVWG